MTGILWLLGIVVFSIGVGISEGAAIGCELFSLLLLISILFFGLGADNDEDED